MELPAGTVLGDRYKVLRRLDQGGVATTWLAEDTEAAAGAREVVLKVLAVRGAESFQVIDLFHREARVLRALAHEGVPRYLADFEAEREGDVLLVLVQERVAGHNLAARLAETGPLPEAKALALGIELCRVLEHLHGLNPPVIHRDIKPSNVVVDDAEGVHLIDFGAVRDTVRPAHEMPKGGDTVVGTIGYMPFEQLAGRALPQSDVHALGMMLAHLVTGLAPEKLRRDDALAWPPSPAVSAPLRTALEHATRPDVASRTSSAAALRAQLEAIRQGVASAPRRRNFHPAAAVAIVFLVPLVPGVAIYIGKSLLQAPRPIAADVIADDRACGVSMRPAPALGVNLVTNPGLDGTCGWAFAPSPHLLSDSAVVLRRDGERVFQDIDVTPLAAQIKGGACDLTLGARMRQAGAGAHGRPYIFGIMQRDATDGAHLSGFPPFGGSTWERQEKTWPLPAATTNVHIELTRSAHASETSTSQAWFDDVTATIICR